MTLFEEKVFLSTPSARRATPSPLWSPRTWSYFYPRPPRGGRHPGYNIGELLGNFYPRPPRGGRQVCVDAGILVGDFYPRPPRGGRPDHLMCAAIFMDFYPRPPRGGRRRNHAGRNPPAYFYPRPPRGGRLSRSTSKVNRSVFLSTPSARRATSTRFYASLTITISIHALREEGDSKNRDKISIFKQIIQHSARI